MNYINFERIIAVLGLSIWFIFPLGMFISVVKQDQESLPSPELNPAETSEAEHLKIFGHKNMIYNDETEEVLIPGDYTNNLEEPAFDDEFNHPHSGIGSTHVHHIP